MCCCHNNKVPAGQFVCKLHWARPDIPAFTAVPVCQGNAQLFGQSFFFFCTFLGGGGENEEASRCRHRCRDRRQKCEFGGVTGQGEHNQTSGNRCEAKRKKKTVTCGLSSAAAHSGRDAEAQAVEQDNGRPAAPTLRFSHRFPTFGAKIHSRLRSRHRGAKMASEGERTVMSRVIQKPGMRKDADA